MIRSLLHLNKDDLVQKGYGWMLKEASNIYPKEIFNYIMKNKRGMELEVLVWWIIAIVVLVIMLTAFFIIRGKGVGALEFIKNVFSLNVKKMLYLRFSAFAVTFPPV